MNDFITWLENKDLINENTFLQPPQKVGDYIFFGIHLINKLFNELKEFPLLSIGPKTGRTDISAYLSPIIEVNSIKQTIITIPKSAPYTMGYRNKNLNSKDRKGRISISSKQLEDLTFLLPEDDQFTKIWVIINNNYQRSMAINLKKQEINKQKEINVQRQTYQNIQRSFPRNFR